MQKRIAAANAGRGGSQHELRRSLDLGHRLDSGPLHAAEKVLEVIADKELYWTLSPKRRTDRAAPTALAGSFLSVLAPIAAGLLAGWVTIAGMPGPSSPAGPMTGDQPLAGLRISGELNTVPEFVEPPPLTGLLNADSLQLEFLQQRMEDSLEFEGYALLPEEVVLTVALRDPGDYIELSSLELSDSEQPARLDIDYQQLLEAYQLLKN